MAKLTIEDLDVKGKNVVMRVDFNVPVADGVITDDNRITAALKSINYVTERGGKVILLSHFGRPKSPDDKEFSLKLVADYLAGKVAAKVHFAGDCIGEEATRVINEAGFGEIVLLENVRFHKGETKNDIEFSKALAAHGDVFVNDAFGSSHRAHSSVAGITGFLQPAAAGYLLEKEIRYLSDSVNAPKRPFVAVLGGAKVSDKIPVIENLISKVDTIIVGGGMTYTFYKAKGLPIGNSKLEEDRVELAGELMRKAEAKGVKLLLPVDSVVSQEFSNDTPIKTVEEDGIEDGWMALDIGPKSVSLFSDVIRQAGTVIWNGPMGVFEMSNFSNGTFAVARSLAEATAKGTISIIGGGDSAAAIKKAGLDDKVTHVSTGGGASLEYLEGKELPGITALTDK
ncbi:MAG: phosphoglycerate kinase Pgk [Bacteroidetes bacterium HLUCCA01]|nr:MAG: phosphoglycerate kinase Pgk [Bacteroidetes bacterium HLUCCA01]